MNIFSIANNINVNNVDELTTEFVHTQKDNGFLINLESAVADILNYAKRNGECANNNTITRDMYDKTSKLLKDRFGINFKLTYSEDAGLAVLPVSIEGHNVMRKADYSELLDVLKDTMDEPKDNDKSTNAERHSETIYKFFVKASSDLENVVRKKGVFVDYKNAKIVGVEDIAPTFIFITPSKLLVNEATAREVVAGIIHEVGHQFFLMAYMYKAIITNAILAESLHSVVNKRNGTIIDGVHIAYEKATGKKPNSKNIISAIIEIKDMYSLEDSKINTDTNFEEYSDVFSSRFGLGYEVSSFLEKLSRDFYTLNSISAYCLFFNMFLIMLVLSVLGGVANMMLLVAVGSSGMLIAALKTILIISIILAFLSTFFPNGEHHQSYPMLVKRIKKMKLDAIRQLKNMKNNKFYSKDDVSGMVKTVESIETLEKYVDSKQGSYFKRLFEIGYSNEELSLREFIENLQELSENKLHYVNAKLGGQ